MPLHCAHPIVDSVEEKQGKERKGKEGKGEGMGLFYMCIRANEEGLLLSLVAKPRRDSLRAKSDLCVCFLVNRF
jgi:hypothetical protein